jgi:hypothetical protein
VAKESIFLSALLHTLFCSFWLFLKANQDVKMEYLDFMKIMFSTLFLEREKHFRNVAPSTARMKSTSTLSASSLQPPDLLLRKRAPQKTLHFTWTIRERNTLC